MIAEDRAYFMRRAAQEDAAANVAESDIARLRHQELARLYRLRAVGAFRDREVAEPKLADSFQAA